MESLESLGLRNTPDARTRLNFHRFVYFSFLYSLNVYFLAPNHDGVPFAKAITICFGRSGTVY